MLGGEPLGYLDDDFLDRVRRAYRLALKANSSPNGGMWRRIAQVQRGIHDALLADSNFEVRRIFANPAASDLFYGADNLCHSVLNGHTPNGDDEPEAKKLLHRLRTFDRREIDFPNPFPGEVGTRTDRGLASYRAIQAAYQAWKIASLIGPKAMPSIVEIGGGLGRTIYYLTRAGFTDCTAIDLPIGMVAQACFLGATLGPSKLWLPGDPPSWSNDRVKLLFATDELPDCFYDVALNVDSLTEMPWRVALGYVRWLNSHVTAFLSINHERNYFHVREAAEFAFDVLKYEQQRCPIRPGYSEEVYYLRRDRARQPHPSFVSKLTFKGKFWYRRIAYHVRTRLKLTRVRSG